QSPYRKKQGRDMMRMAQLPLVDTTETIVQRPEHDLDLLRRLSLGLHRVASPEGQEAMDRVRVVGGIRAKRPGPTPFLRHVPRFLAEFPLSRAHDGMILFVQGPSGEFQDD